MYRVSKDASNFVNLSDVCEDIIIEMRYYSTFNFVGKRIDGYEMPVALMTKEAAMALKKASDEFKEKGFRLKVFDAYRPVRAVRHFAWWANFSDEKMKRYFYSNITKKEIIEKGYVAKRSGHSRGSTIDLTLFSMNAEKDCDMGAQFDHFGPSSSPKHIIGLNPLQIANRKTLKEIMEKHGFIQSPDEFWHFTYKDEPFKNTYFDFPVSLNSLNEFHPLDRLINKFNKDR